MPRLVVVLALLGAVSACDSFDPEWVETLNLQPDSVYLEPGESAVFTAEPLSQRGDVLADRAGRVRFSLENSSAVSGTAGEGQMTVTANEVGSARLFASLGRGSGIGRVYVQPAGLARIEMEVSQLTLPRGSRPNVRVFLYDAQGNEMDPGGFRISWTVGDSSLIFVGQLFGPVTNLFLRRTGTTTLRVIVGDQSTSIPVTIT